MISQISGASRDFGHLEVGDGCISPEAPLRLTGVESQPPNLALTILLAALTLTVMEGALRKWVTDSGFQISGYVAYFSKDIVFALLLLQRARAPFFLALMNFHAWLVPGSFLIVCGALMSATQEINVGGAVLTLRAVLLLPVMALVAILRLNCISLYAVSVTTGILTVINFSLGVVQNNLPAEHLINRYAYEAVQVVVGEMGVRATGTFSYISGMGVMALVGVWSGMVCISLAKNIWQQMFGWSVVAMGIGCGLASVSRGPVFIGVVMLLSWLVISPDWAIRKSRSLISGVLIWGVLAVVGLNRTFSKLWEGLFLRAERAGDSAQERTLGSITDAIVAIDMAPFGHGLGTEQIGGNYFSSGEMTFTTFETQFARLIIETGVLGMLGFVMVCVGAILALQVAKLHTNASGGASAVLATQLFMVGMFGTNVVFNHTASAFVWLIFAATLASCAPCSKHYQVRLS